MRKDIVVIGTSTGGLEALNVLVAGLPRDFAGSCFIVRHTRFDSPGLLASLLERAGDLPASTVADSQPIEPGKIYVAAPDRHLLIAPEKVYASAGPKENRFRPAVDPLFRSAAHAYGARVIGVVLSGALDDGTQGLSVIKAHGGTAIVQDPADAIADSMPRSALAQVKVDYCLPVADMAALLVRLTADYIAEESPIVSGEEEKIELRIARGDDPIEAGVMRIGDPSPYTCPECHGVLLRMKQEGLIRFRCHTGHAYSIGSLMAELDESTEDAIWNALRCVQEQKLLLTHMADHLADAKFIDGSEQALEKAREARKRASTLQGLLTGERSELGR
jgi:two-component system, chemotaxis family, protein-glutamate methylesterase/glutaminase